MNDYLNKIVELYKTNDVETAKRFINSFCKEIFGYNIDGNSLWSTAVNYYSDLLRLYGDTKQYDKLSLKGISNGANINELNQIEELLNNTDKNNYQTLVGIMSFNEELKNIIYTYLSEKVTKYLEKEKKFSKEDSTKIVSDFDKLHDDDTIEVKMFDKNMHLKVHSFGDNQFDESGNYKENGFELTKEELVLLKSFLQNVNLDDYKDRIINYINNEYYNAGYDKKITADDIPNELKIKYLAIILKKSLSNNNTFPNIALVGECDCDDEHGICIGFKDNEMVDINQEDWIL